MKYNYKKTILAVVTGLVLTGLNTGCSKIDDFGSTNTRSDASTIPLTKSLITSAESQIGGIMTSLAGGLRASLYAQHFAEEQYTEQSTYATPQLDYGTSYSGPLMDLQTIINLNTDAATKGSVAVTSGGSNGNQLAVAKILKAYWIWTLTDRWGDVPASEALKGAGNFSPAYDTQEAIYKSLFATLTEAIGNFDGGNAVVGDFIYSGNQGKWKKLANSLRMLMAINLSKKYPSASDWAANEFKAAFNDANGAITSNTDNFTAKYDGASAIATNVWYNTLNGRKDYDLSLTLADILTNMGDPRRNAFGTTGNPMPYGLTRDLAVAYTNSVSGNISRPFATKNTNTPVVIVPAAYTLLAQAEAVELGWIGGSGKTYYDAAVTASFAQWGAGSAATYLAGAADYNTGVGGGTNIGFKAGYTSIVGADAKTTTPLQRIYLQKYLASFGDGIQAWSIWRRTGVPNLVPTAFATNTPKAIPIRYTYGINEYATNTANVSAAAGKLSGGDIMSAKFWWLQ